MGDEVKRLRDENERLRKSEDQWERFVAHRQREVERLRGLLARLEWSAGEYGDMCPACGAMTGTAPIPHTPDCWLAAELDR